MKTTCLIRWYRNIYLNERKRRKDQFGICFFFSLKGFVGFLHLRGIYFSYKSHFSSNRPIQLEQTNKISMVLAFIATDKEHLTFHFQTMSILGWQWGSDCA